MAMGPHAPLIAIEIVMVFGGALLFGWWQLRSIRKDQAAAAAQRIAADDSVAEGASTRPTDVATPRR